MINQNHFLKSVYKPNQILFMKKMYNIVILSKINSFFLFRKYHPLEIPYIVLRERTSTKSRRKKQLVQIKLIIQQLIISHGKNLML